MALHFIFMILNRDYRDSLFKWCSENMGFCCAQLVTAYLQFMPCVKHLPFGKAGWPLWKTQPVLSQLGERLKGQSIPIGQGHGLQGRNVARFLVKGREDVVHAKTNMLHTSAWIVYHPLNWEWIPQVVQERHLKEFCMQVLQYWIKKCSTCFSLIVSFPLPLFSWTGQEND